MASKTVTAEGLQETIRTLKKLGVEVEDLKGAFTRIGSRATAKVKAGTPVKSGRLQATVKQSKRQNSVYIYSGSKKAYYAPFVHFGTKTISKNPWMTRVATAEGPYAIKQLENEVNSIIRKYGLDK